MKDHHGFELPFHGGHAWRRAVVLLIALAGLAAVAQSDTLHRALMDLMNASEAVIAAHPLAGACLFILAAAISAMFAFVSVAAVVPIAVLTWGAFFTTSLLWMGWIIGGVLAYSVGRHLGRPAVSWLTAHSDALTRLERRVSPQTPLSLVFLFQLALPSEIPGYVLGLVKYPLARYLLSLGLAELPYALATVYLGQTFVARRSGVLIAVGIALASASVLSFYFLRKRLTSR